jgi:hypothetical protein
MDRAGLWNSKGRIVSAVAVTPSDVTVIQKDVLYVGTAGDIAVICRDDTVAATFKNVGSGEWLLASVKKVMSTNTTATDILGCLVEFEVN